VHHLRCSEQRPAWQNWFYRQVERAYLKSVDGFIFNSQTTRQVVEAISPHNRPFVVAHPPTDRFGQPMNQKQIINRSHEGGPLKLVFVGNLIHRKGLHILLAALQQVPAPMQLEIIGGANAEPAYAARMKTLAASLPGHIRVTFHGALGDAALAEQLRRAYLLVVPSSYEGFGIVYLEGMAFGLPAIGSRTGAAPEIITDGQDGYLIPPDDSAYLARLLAQLSANRALLETLSINALSRYQRQPRWAETAGRIRQFLLEQLS
jgi:glycosyltransferase involved in cell wall biosynthesis